MSGEYSDLIDKLKNDPIIQFIVKRKKIFFTGFFLGSIVLLTLLLRINTFWLPHWVGDQSHYLSLAMKLDHYGFSHYNLRGVDVKFIYFDKNKKLCLVLPAPAGDISSKGMILEALDMVGIHYYDQPLFHKPPALPYALLVSHKLFTKRKQPYTVVYTNIRKFLWKKRPIVFFRTQFYASIVPIVFSVGLVICTFFIGSLLFSDRVGLYAALLMAINPVSILTAHKLWADDMLSFFAALSVILFIIAIQKRWDWFMLLSGIACGFAVLAKQTGGYLVFSFLIFLFITHEKRIFHIQSMPMILFNRRTVLFVFGVFLISGFWFFKVYGTFGNPLYLPGQSDILQKDMSGWFTQLAKRPAGPILYLIGIPYLCPMFAIAFISFKNFISDGIKAITKKGYDYRFLLLWLIVIVFYYSLRANKEHRYMLPTYPAIAVLASCYLDRFRIYSGKFSRFLGNERIRNVVLLILFLLCAVWTVPIGIGAGLEDKILLKIPF